MRKRVGITAFDVSCPSAPCRLSLDQRRLGAETFRWPLCVPPDSGCQHVVAGVENLRLRGNVQVKSEEDQ